MKLQFLTMESVKPPQSVSLHILISLQQSHTDYSNIYLEFFNTHSRIFPHDEQNWLIFFDVEGEPVCVSPPVWVILYTINFLLHLNAAAPLDLLEWRL